MPAPRTHRTTTDARHRRTRGTVAAAAVLLSAGSLLFSPGTARADDPAALQAQIDAAKASLTSLQTRTEQVAEKMNAARIAQAATDRASAAAQARLGAVRAELAGVRTQVGSLALRSFEASTDRTLALLGSGDPATFLSRASDFAEVSRSRGQQITQLRAADKRQADAQAAADSAAAAAKAVAGEIAGQQRTIADSLSQQRDLLGQLQQRQAELIRQAQEAAAKAAAAKAAAAQQAAAQQALVAAQAEKARIDMEAHALAAAQALPPPPPPSAQSAPAPVVLNAVPVAQSVQPTPSAPAAPAPPTTADNAPVDQAPVQVQAAGDAGATALDAARSQIGKPYVYGAGGPDSYDCSGLTSWAYARAGISLSHYTGAQWNEGRHVGRGELQPGDLVFFGADLGHVGVYSGGGSMVDAPHSGAYVREEPMFGDYAGAVRPGG